jgi:hypothetical protein
MDLLDKLTNDFITMEIAVDKRFVQRPRASAVGPHDPDHRPNSSSLLNAFGALQQQQPKRSSTNTASARTPDKISSPAGGRIQEIPPKEKGEGMEGHRVGTTRNDNQIDDDTRVATTKPSPPGNTFLYCVCYLLDPTIGLRMTAAADDSVVTHAMRALREEATVGVLANDAIVSKYGLKPRTAKLKEFVEAMATPELDYRVPEALVQYVADVKLKVKADNNLDKKNNIGTAAIAIIRSGGSRGGLLPSVWITSSAASEYIVFSSTKTRAYSLGSIDPMSTTQLRQQYAKCVRSTSLSEKDELSRWIAAAQGEDDLLAMLPSMLPETLTLTLGASDKLLECITASTAPKRSKAKKAAEERRSALALEVDAFFFSILV